MGKGDVELRDLISTFIIPCFFLTLWIFIFLTDSVDNVRKRFSRWMLKDFAVTHDKLTADVKRALFEDLPKIESRVVDLRNKGLIRVLEIGVGAGTNLKYYPQQCRLVVVDPTLYFKQYFNENKAKFPDIHLEKYIVSGAEHLRGVPTNSVDVLVTTAVLCSVTNVHVVFREIKRVLVPGGRYYFLEHCLDETVTNRRTLHKFLNWSGIWPSLLDGCKFLPIRTEILMAGFSHVDYKEFELDTGDLTGRLKIISRLMAPHIVGIAKN